MKPPFASKKINPLPQIFISELTALKTGVDMSMYV